MKFKVRGINRGLVTGRMSQVARDSGADLAWEGGGTWVHGEGSPTGEYGESEASVIRVAPKARRQIRVEPLFPAAGSAD